MVTLTQDEFPHLVAQNQTYETLALTGLHRAQNMNLFSRSMGTINVTITSFKETCVSALNGTARAQTRVATATSRQDALQHKNF